MKTIPMSSIIVLLSLLLFPSSSYSLNIDRIDIEPICNQEIHNQGRFKILDFLKEFKEMLTEDLEDKSSGYDDTGLLDACHGFLFERSAVEGLEILELSGSLGPGKEVKCYKDFIYYNYYNQNPLTVSIYRINTFFNVQSQQLSLQAHCKTKHITAPPKDIFGTWMSTNTNSDFYEKGQQILKINPDNLSWEKETTYRFFWPRSKAIEGTPSFYCRARFKGFIHNTNIPSLQDELLSHINSDSLLIYQLFFKVTEVELIDSAENGRDCPQLVDEMNNTIGMGDTQLKKYGLSIYDYPLIPGYLQSILSVEIRELPVYELQKEKFKYFGKRKFERVHPQTKGVILTFNDEPSVEVKTLIINEMENLNLVPFKESRGVEYTSERHFNVDDRTVYRLNSDRAYQWTFRWLDGTRTRLETLNICREKVSSFHPPDKNPPCEPYYAFESP